MLKKKELDLEIVKVSGKKTKTAGNKIYNVFFFQGLEEQEDKGEYNIFY